MAFPSTPTNGQLATIGGITYTYNSTKTAWIRTPSVGANLTVNSLSITSATPAISTTSGALLVSGGAGVQGNLHVGGDVFIGNAQISTKGFAIAMSIGLG